jgi:uncharacterized membrane protein YbhN (UPF0104 family)
MAEPAAAHGEGETGERGGEGAAAGGSPAGVKDPAPPPGLPRPPPAAPASPGAPGAPGAPASAAASQADRHAAHLAAARVRRPADALLSVAAAILVAALLGLAHALPEGTQEITTTVENVVRHVPDALRVFFETLSYIGCIAFGVVALVHLFRREVHTALDAIAATPVAAILGGIAVTFWEPRKTNVAIAVLGRHGSTTSFVVVGVYVAFVTGSDLARRARWTRWCVISAAALACSELFLGALTAYGFLVVLPAGWSVGLITRWALGAASVQPAPDELRLALEAVDIEVASLEPPARRYGDWFGELADGTRVHIRLANRDTRGAGVARRLWGLVRLRTSVSGRASFGGRSQLESEALACYAAAGAGVRAPRVLALAEVGDATLMRALPRPPGGACGHPAPPKATSELFTALRRLHAAGVAHRDLRAVNLLVADGEAGFSSLDTALPGAGELVRRIDVVQLLTTTSHAVGIAESVREMREAYRPEDEGLIAAMLQPIALSSWGWQSMRAEQGMLGELRKALLGEDDLSTNIRLERFRWRTVVSAVALTFAAYVLVGQLSKVNLLGTLSHTNLAWFALAVAASAATYLGGAANLAAFVPKRLSLVRGFFVQLSTSFVGMAMPPTVGHVAVNARYLHRQGVDDAETAAAVAISQAVNVVTTVPLLVVLGLLTGSGVSSFHLSFSPTLLGVIGSVVALLGVFFAVPRTRRMLLDYVVPRLRHLGPRVLAAVSQPLRLAAGVAGNLLLTISYVVALGACLLAVGAHPSWLGVAAVYLAGNTVGSAAPTPGGLGAVEVVLSAGLTAIGIPAHHAVAAVLLYRLATFWLPIPSGWVAYEFLQRSGTL